MFFTLHDDNDDDFFYTTFIPLPFQYSFTAQNLKQKRLTWNFKINELHKCSLGLSMHNCRSSVVIYKFISFSSYSGQNSPSKFWILFQLVLRLSCGHNETFWCFFWKEYNNSMLTMWCLLPLISLSLLSASWMILKEDMVIQPQP